MKGKFVEWVSMILVAHRIGDSSSRYACLGWSTQFFFCLSRFLRISCSISNSYKKPRPI
uniref:Uncharacterized protein n=1 Tax=Siphoviridae sp. ctj7g1 TaxID=2826438 RepID=A0A8S5R1R1_9CAUD|nr:MAG TPA: hypothetical protein [Siphoviridae sp. ctj7g1]